jgi:hypothetical protein
MATLAVMPHGAGRSLGHGTITVMCHGNDGGHATGHWSQSCAMACIEAPDIFARPAFLAGL